MCVFSNACSRANVLATQAWGPWRLAFRSPEILQMLSGCDGPLVPVAWEDTEKLPRANWLARPGLTQAASVKQAEKWWKIIPDINLGLSTCMRAHTSVCHMQKPVHLQTYVHMHMSLLHVSCIATDQIRQIKDHLKLYQVHIDVSLGILFYFVFGFVFSLNGPPNFIEANRDKRFGFTTQLMTMAYCVLWMRQQRGAGN